MSDVWNTTADRCWIFDAKMTPELEEELKQALEDYKNDPVKQAALEARLAPYKTKPLYRGGERIIY